MTAPVESVTAELMRAPLGPHLRRHGTDTVDIVFVRIRDRDGAEGTGFTYTLDAGAGVVCRMIDEVVAPALHSRTTADWDDVYRSVAAGTRRLGTGVFVPALSAVDIAVWDLRGVQHGRALYELFHEPRNETHGETRPPPVPIYGSGRSANSLTVDELIAGAQSYVAEGFNAVKVRAGSRAVAEDLERLRAVRRVLGDDVRLMVDCNERLDFETALAFGSGLADLGYDWLEEPLPAEHLRDHGRLARELPVAVAVGEHLNGCGAVAAYLDHTDVAVYQPDAALGGGITEVLRVSELVARAGRRISYHSLPDLHVHLAVDTDAVDYVEDFPILSGLLAETLPTHDGTVRATTRPGHGLQWDGEALRRAQERATSG